MQKENILRPAIAMIELIFAIVIMGIVMMSAPMLISTAAKSGYVTIQQEAINEASAQVSMILSYPWDEQNADYALTATILTTTGGNPLLNASLPAAAPDRRAGTPLSSQRKFIEGTGTVKNATAVVNLGLDGVEVVGGEDDMDDFTGTATALSQLGAATPSDTIQKTNEVTIARAVAYNVDNSLTYDTANLAFVPFVVPPVPNTTANIKEITVNIQSTDAGTANEVTELAKNITLKAFSCNIGSYELEER